MPPRFVLQTFGGLAMFTRDGGEPVLVNQRKRLAFIAALAADANGMAREGLIALFWPESNTERARNALNQLVFAIRRDLGEAILADSVSIRLDPEVIGSDVRSFRDAIANKRFADAIAEYRGPFLDGVYLHDAPRFERWADDIRAALAGDYARALERELDAALSTAPARVAEALRYARLLAAHDPLSTQGALRLMRALELSGDTQAALRHATTHGARVRAELEGEPGPELEREVARLRAKRSVDTTASAEAKPAAAIAATNEPRETPAVPRVPSKTQTSWSRRALIVGAAAATLAITWFAGTKMEGGRAASDAPDSSRVLVVPLVNHTGDSTLDFIGYIASDWITQALAHSELVNVVYGPTAFELARSAAGDTSHADSDRVRLMAQRSTAGTVISGSYYLVHDSIVINAKVTDARSGRLLRSVPSIVAPKSDPMGAVQELRERSVGALATVLNPRIAGLSGLSSPPPLGDAYREYLEGLEAFRRGAPPSVSLERFLGAAHADSSFMLPLIWATMMASNAGNVQLRDSMVQVLEVHRPRLAPSDRYALDFLEVAFDSTSRARDVIAAGSRIAALAPASNWSVLQASYLYSAGYAREALDMLDRVDPEQGWAGSWRTYWAMRTTLQHRLGQYGAELQSAQRANRAGNGSIGRTASIRALIALGRADSAMTLVRDAAPSLNDAERLALLAVAAREMRAHGRPERSDSLYRIVLDWFRARRDQPEMRALRRDYIDYALQADALDDAKTAADAVLSDPPNEIMAFEARGALGVVAASKGDRAGALEQIRQMPDPRGHRVAYRWYEAEFKALVAGALHEREMAIQYLAEMEAQGQRADPDAASLTEVYPQLRWLADDPRIGRPYVGGTP